MASSFASQLQAIARNSTHELDVKARRSAHAESLLFERDVAVKQDFGSIFAICLEGYRELCQLDDRFRDFERNLFSEQAKDQDRDQMTREENEALDVVVKRCLMLLAGKILLKPGQKTLEWLVRRFQVHIYNVDALLLSLLPYHEVAIWANVLSIIPNDKVVASWKFLRPYLKTTWTVPRHAVAYAAANNDPFFTAMNNFVLATCQQGLAHPTLLKFWSAMVVEAINSRLIQTRSGRKEVQSQRVQDLLHQILPLLSDGLETPGCVDLVITCYTITIVLASKADLADHLLDSLLLAVAQSLLRPDHDAHAAVVAMSVVLSHKDNQTLPKNVLSILLDLEALPQIIRGVADRHSCQSFLTTAIVSATAHVKRRNVLKMAAFIEQLISLVYDVFPSAPLPEVVQPLLVKIFQLDHSDDRDSEVRNELVSRIQRLNENDALSRAISTAATAIGYGPSVVESMLGVALTVTEPLKMSDENDTVMVDVRPTSVPNISLLDDVPSVPPNTTSFLAVSSSAPFDSLARAFNVYHATSDMIQKVQSMATWTKSGDRDLLWQTFLLRYACSGYPAQARSRAIQLLQQQVKSLSTFNSQVLLTHALTLLNDVKPIRTCAAELLNLLGSVTSDAALEAMPEGPSMTYASSKASTMQPLPHQQVASILSDVVAPIIEECILDQSYIVKAIQHALQPSSQDHKRHHKQALFTILSQHALATPCIKFKISVLAMLAKLQKLGGRSKSKVLLPIVQEWSQLSHDEAKGCADEAGLLLEQVDAAFVQLVDVHDRHFLTRLTEAALSAETAYRKELIFALFEHIRRDWAAWTLEQQVSCAGWLFETSFLDHDALAAAAQDMLRLIDIPSEVLAEILEMSQTGASEIRLPTGKCRKRSSSSGISASRADAIRSVDEAAAKISLALELVEGNLPETKPELATIMFDMLSTLKQLQQNRINSPYLLNLSLSSIGAMFSKSNVGTRNIDASTLRPELVTDCLRNSDNLQVQNSALLLLASLATVVPDRMVHNVMPIFTFIGHNMLSKDDEHSVNVINEAIDKIVPALLNNLRRGRNQEAYQDSIVTMLSSFTSAYSHIPPHRRVPLYQKLLACIGAADYGFMLIALVAHQQRHDPALAKFIQELVGTTPARTQLAVYEQLMQTAKDALESSPKTAARIFNIQQSTNSSERQQYAESCLKAASRVLQTRSLATALQQSAISSGVEVTDVQLQLRATFKTTLSTIKLTHNSGEKVFATAKHNMDLLLQLPSLTDLLEALYNALDDMEAYLRPQALRILSTQITRKTIKKGKTQQMAIKVLQKIQSYISPASDDKLLQSSLVCVDRIAEAYGRKHPDEIIAVAEHILSHVGLFKQHQSMGGSDSILLTVASLVEVLREAAVPLVSPILEQGLVILQKSTQSSASGPSNTLLALLCSVFSHAAFVISEEQLSSLLEAMTSPDFDDRSIANPDLDRLVQTVATKVDLETLVGALQLVIPLQRQGTSTNLLLDLLGKAIDSSTKSAVIKSSDRISDTVLQVLDAEARSAEDRRQTGMKLSSRWVVSEELKNASLKFVYKLNDATFRPIFETWTDWAVETTSDSQTESASRQVVLFDLLADFFESLKAIVTSYATYLLKSISTILQQATSATPIPLIAATLTLLRTIATHDTDSFLTAPSHFTPIAEPLISVLRLSSNKSTRTLLHSHTVPTVRALALATLDSPSTHATLTHHITALKSHPSCHVRLGSIQTLTALSEDEVVGDEFIANTIGVGSGEGEGARGSGGVGSVGEIMVYVNEMLEDDDEHVEAATRRWVRIVREKVGEDVFD